MISFLLATVVAAKTLKIDPLKHHVIPLQASKFDTVINSHRGWQISAVFFYKPEDSASAAAFSAFDAVAADLKGMFKFGAIDCAEQAKFCQKNDVKQFPTVMIYPRNPLPAFPFPGAIANKEELTKVLVKQLPTEHVTVLKPENYDSFLTSDGHLPKVILVSTKSAPPAIFKALSNEFRNEMHFGLINFESNKALADKLKVKAAPSLVMQEAPNKPFLHYKGEMKFTEIHTWANMRRETFVQGGGFDHQRSSGGQIDSSAAPAKPKIWLTQSIPEITKDSNGDVCFKSEGLCVIYLKQGPITDAETALLEKVKGSFESQVTLKWGWIDLSLETAFKDLFNPTAMPSAVVFNPHKRLRFAGLDRQANADSITALIEKVLGGDARFTQVKDQKLPAFVKREQAKEEL